MPKIIKHSEPINQLHQNVLDEWGTVTFCAKKLGYKTHSPIYRMIHNGMNEGQVLRMKACGYDENFRRIK